MVNNNKKISKFKKTAKGLVRLAKWAKLDKYLYS